MLMVLKDNNKRREKGIWKNKKFSESIKHALQGIKTIFLEERNMRHHASLGIFHSFWHGFFK